MSKLSLTDKIALLVAYAYPDRIAQQRAKTTNTQQNKYRLSNGRGAILVTTQQHLNAPLIIATNLSGGSEAHIHQAVPIKLELLERYHSHLFDEIEHTAWDSKAECVVTEHQIRLGACVLERQAIQNPDADQVSQYLLQGIREKGLQCLPWDKASTELRQRLGFMYRLEPTKWRAMNENDLLQQLEQWLLPYLQGMSRISHLKSLNLSEILLHSVDWQQRQQLNRWAPSHIQVPSGSHIKVNYDNEPPILAVRLQEIFGWLETPKLGAGRVELLLHILSPAQRPVQITQDLQTFWRQSYHEVKKDMAGRYPKHYWPDNPLQAQATKRTKPR